MTIVLVVGYNTGEDLAGLFGDVKVVLMGGSSDRMASIAAALTQHIPPQESYSPKNLARSDRFNTLHLRSIFI